MVSPMLETQPEFVTQPAAAATAATKLPTTTPVNGRGLWNSWTRNFATPLSATWDLVDNALDATLHGQAAAADTAPPFHGKLHVEACSNQAEPKKTSGDETESDEDEEAKEEGPGRSTRQASNTRTGRASRQASSATGIRMLNNSVLPIPPLTQVLTVHHSHLHKQGTADSIGENGVGLKQACATLSNLSLVLTRNTTTTAATGFRQRPHQRHVFSLGLVALELQKATGCYLPSWQFRAGNLESLRDELMDKFVGSLGEEIVQDLSSVDDDFNDVRRVLKEYGQGSIRQGVLLIWKHFEDMCSGTWAVDQHVFGLVVHQLKHRCVYRPDSDTEASEKQGAATASDSDGRDVESLLYRIREAFPKQYIHIPSSFDVRIDSKPVSRQFWQRRLVDLTQFSVIMDTKDPVAANDLNEHKVGGRSPGRRKKQPSHRYAMTVYLGFDAVRQCDSTVAKQAMLLVYSRTSGRLIREYEDGRRELGLSNQGSEFGQGLVIIVDDHLGRLPLNPTKQDLAFGEHANGATHHENLRKACGAVAKAYYHFYWKTLFGESKGALGAAVSEQNQSAIDYVNDDIDHEQGQIQPLSSGEFNSFSGVKFANHMTAGICLAGRSSFKIVRGKDTLLRMNISPVAQSPAPKKRGRQKKDASAQKVLPTKQAQAKAGKRKRDADGGSSEVATLISEMKALERNLEEERETRKRERKRRKHWEAQAQNFEEEAEYWKKEAERVEARLSAEKKRSDRLVRAQRSADRLNKDSESDGLTDSETSASSPSRNIPAAAAAARRSSSARSGNRRLQFDDSSDDEDSNDYSLAAV